MATRLLGSGTEADDAVQEAWLRLSRTDAGSVENLGGWLTTVVGRVALNMLRSRTTRREEPLDGPPARSGPAHDPDPADNAVLADSVGLALLVVLETLTPAERLAFVLHDLFDVPFDEIAPIVGPHPGRGPAAGQPRPPPGPGLGARARPRPGRRREVVAAFLAASRSGDFGALLALLDPDAVLRADAAAVAFGAPAEVRGARRWPRRSPAAPARHGPALVDGVVDLVWSQGGQPRVVFAFTLADGIVTAIDMHRRPRAARRARRDRPGGLTRGVCDRLVPW